MRAYSPKRRTALVLAGTGVSGAYHAGVLKALDESGVKIDLVVGSGVGAVSAAFAAAAAGQRLYAADGFWRGARERSFLRLRPFLRMVLGLLAAIVGVFLVPAALALLVGLLSPVLLVAWFLFSRFGHGLPETLDISASGLANLYAASLATVSFALGLLLVSFILRHALGDRRRMGEAFEAAVDPRPGEERLGRALWEVARGPATSSSAPSTGELSKRFVGLLAENLGQPGFRELILRVADLESAAPLSFVLLQDEHRAAYAAVQAKTFRPRTGVVPGTIDLKGAGYETLAYDAIRTGLLPPLGGPCCRIAFPRGGLYAGEVHRVADATVAGGCGLSEAVAAGADQVILVLGVPQAASPPPRRRGPRAMAGGILASLEKQAADRELEGAERLNRIIDTLGHSEEGGGRGWEDPASGRVYRSFGLWVIRPDRRTTGPWEIGGARDPASEALETLDDLIDRGYHDAYRLFLEPIVGDGERVHPAAEDKQPIEL